MRIQLEKCATRKPKDPEFFNKFFSFYEENAENGKKLEEDIQTVLKDFTEVLIYFGEPSDQIPDKWDEWLDEYNALFRNISEIQTKLVQNTAKERQVDAFRW